MPLDVQPLSSSRQLLRLLVLLTLLGASLGFAHYLTVSRHAHSPASLNLESLGFAAPLMEDEPADYELDARTGIVGGNPRELRIFYGPYKLGANTSFPLPEDLMKDIAAMGPRTNSVIHIGKQDWLQVYVHNADKSFILTRFLVHADRALVICYSGDGKKTDADISTLDTLCSNAAEFDPSQLPN